MEYFYDCDFPGEFPWFEEALPAAHHSAFVKYRRNQSTDPGFGAKSLGMNHQNVNKRMIGFLKKNWTPMIVPIEAEKERNHKHMISERMRRDKERQSYMELHKMLPHGTKKDKHSIVQMAAERIEEQQRYTEELKRRNYELEMALAAGSKNKEMEEAKIRLKVAYPSSGIDSFLEVLNCLKSTGSVPKVIQSNFSAQEFSAVLHIETKIAATEVEKAVHKTLFEVEKKFLCPFPEE